MDNKKLTPSNTFALVVLAAIIIGITFFVVPALLSAKSTLAVLAGIAILVVEIALISYILANKLPINSSKS